ncbi:MAG: hypothetical protein R3A79_20265 [Nannocystaceae bacterium]
MSSAPDVADYAAQLRAEGYTCLPALLRPEEVAPFAEALRGEWLRLGRPATLSRADVHLEPGVHVSPVGLTCASVLARIPGLAAVLLRPELLAIFAELLGPGFELEFGAGVLSDDSRPFFFWHHHVGGIDAADLRRAGYPAATRVERLGCTLYATPLDDANGVMQIWPRAAVGPTDPPFRPGEEPWPGATQLRAPAGSVVLFDQGTWHAVTPMRRPGQRFFFGFFIRRRGLSTRRCDPRLAEVFARDPRLAAAYGGAQR